jgi:hypothetical protein
MCSATAGAGMLARSHAGQGLARSRDAHDGRIASLPRRRFRSPRRGLGHQNDRARLRTRRRRNDAQLGHCAARPRLRTSNSKAASRRHWPRRAAGDPRVSEFFGNLAVVQIILGDLDAARMAARRFLESRGDDHELPCAALQNLATVSALRGDPHVAARLIGYIDALYKGRGKFRGH